MKTKIVASSFIRSIANGTFLILRRSDTDTSRVGEWDLAGGVVDEGESIRGGALREVKEETGISETTKSQLFFTTSGVAYSNSSGEYINYIFLYYLLETVDGLPVKLSFEHDQFKWVKKEELPRYLTHKAQKAACTYLFTHELDS